MDNNYQSQQQPYPQNQQQFNNGQPYPQNQNDMNNGQNFQQQPNNDVFQGPNNMSQQPQNSNSTPDADKKATTAFICSLVGLIICAPLEIFALIYGIMALKNNTAKRGMAIASVIISSIGLVIWICSLIFILPGQLASIG